MQANRTLTGGALQVVDEHLVCQVIATSLASAETCSSADLALALRTVADELRGHFLDDGDAATAAIGEAIEGFDRAIKVLPPGETTWRGRFLRLRYVLAQEAGQRHLRPHAGGGH